MFKFSQIVSKITKLDDKNFTSKNEEKKLKKFISHQRFNLSESTVNNKWNYENINLVNNKIDKK